MGLFYRLSGKKSRENSHDEPFMEHPSGNFKTAKDAIENAIERLWALEDWSEWITFSGQGQGNSPETYHIEDVRMLGHTFDVGDREIDLGSVLRLAGLTDSGLKIESAGGKITIHDATPAQLADFLDSLFRNQLGIRPFEDENAYAVGAEW